MGTEPKAETQAVAEVMKAHLEPREIVVDDKGHKGWLLPVGIEPYSIKELADEYRDAPERRQGTATLQELDSFIGHVMRFKDADSAIFADPNPSRPTLTAVLDYHRIGAEGPPRFMRHRSVYAFPLDKAWLTWTAISGKEIGQATFAEFLERNILDVIDPRATREDGGTILGESVTRFLHSINARPAAGPELMELSRGLTVRVGSHCRNAVNLATGEVQLQYDTEHTDERGAPLNVPRAFVLGIPVFRGGELYQVPVRLRYRHKEGALTWILDPLRMDLVFDDAIKGAVDKTRESTGLPVFIGSPEA